MIINTPIKILLVSLFSFSVAASFATNKTINIGLQSASAPYVNLLGSAVGASKYFSVEDIKPIGGGRPKVKIGSLGLESNISGSCTLKITTKNKFKLKHTISNKRLTRYILRYRGKKFNKNKSTMVLSSCNVASKALKLKRKGPLLNKIKSGVYQDVIYISVTTQ